MDLRPLILAGALIACGEDESAEAARVQSVAPPHPDYIVAGPAPTSIDTIPNPFAGDERARATGKRLYEQYNCVSCHGADGAGGIGPTLNDERWKYGGTPDAIFASIYEGRPEGMPIWGGTIPDEQIWQLVTYLESLSGPDLGTISWPGVPAQAARRTPVR